jgi:hypothetical protein
MIVYEIWVPHAQLVIGHKDAFWASSACTCIAMTRQLQGQPQQDPETTPFMTQRTREECAGTGC